MLYTVDIYNAINYKMRDTKKVNEIGLHCLKIPPISRHSALDDDIERIRTTYASGFKIL